MKTIQRKPGTITIKNVSNRADNKKTAIIDIDGDIGYGFWWDDEPDKNTKENVKQQLKDIAAIKADIIEVNINSLGGDFNHAISIYDLLAENTAEVHTKLNGMSASSATIIFMAGKVRKISANSLGLIHEARSGVYGPIAMQLENIKMLEKVNGTIAKLYAKGGVMTEKQAAKQMKVDNGEGEWQTADEFLRMGLATEIYEPTQMAAFYDTGKYRLPKVPENKLKIINKKPKTMAKEKAAGEKNKETPDNKEKKTGGVMAVLKEIKALVTNGKGNAEVNARLEQIEARVKRTAAKNKQLKETVKAQAEELETTKRKLAKAKGTVKMPKAKKGTEDPKNGNPKKQLTAHQKAEAANQKALELDKI